MGPGDSCRQRRTGITHARLRSSPPRDRGAASWVVRSVSPEWQLRSSPLPREGRGHQRGSQCRPIQALRSSPLPREGRCRHARLAADQRRQVAILAPPERGALPIRTHISLDQAVLRSSSLPREGRCLAACRKRSTGSALRSSSLPREGRCTTTDSLGAVWAKLRSSPLPREGRCPEIDDQGPLTAEVAILAPPEGGALRDVTVRVTGQCTLRSSPLPREGRCVLKRRLKHRGGCCDPRPSRGRGAAWQWRASHHCKLSCDPRPSRGRGAASRDKPVCNRCWVAILAPPEGGALHRTDHRRAQAGRCDPRPSRGRGAASSQPRRPSRRLCCDPRPSRGRGAAPP